MQRIVVIALLLLLAGCSTPRPSANQDPLVGKWSTGRIMSQLGPSRTRVTFRSDHTFSMSSRAFFIPFRNRGTYRVDGAKILFEGKHPHSMGFHFEGEHLILTEPGDTFTLHRTGNAR